MSKRESDSDNLRASSSFEQREVDALRVYQPYLHLSTTILGSTSLSLISMRLDPDDLVCRNWRFMGERMGFDNWEIRWFERQQHRAAEMIKRWSLRCLYTLGDLINLVHVETKRRDVFTDVDVAQAIMNDVMRHQHQQRSRHCSQPNVASYYSSPSYFSFTSGTTSPLRRCKRSHSETPFACSPINPSFFRQYSSSTDRSSTLTPSAGHSLLRDRHMGPVVDQEPAQQEPDSTTSLSPKKPPSASKQTFDVFLLCKPEDDFVREELIPRFKQNEVRFCHPEYHLPLGEDAFNSTINYMLYKCRKIVVVLADDLMQNREAEWLGSLVLSENRDLFRGRLIPIKCKPLAEENIAFGRLVAVDFTTTQDKERSWDRIIQAVKT